MITTELERDTTGRYPAIDIFRGVAIFTMLCANSAAESLAAPHPFLLRIYGSFAAPIFIFLAGFMVALTARKDSIVSCFMRGLAVLLVAALIDVLIWHVTPFTTFDVLYLIGLGIPIAAITLRMKIGLRVFLCLACLAAGPLLSRAVGYDKTVHEFDLHGVSTTGIVSEPGWWVRSFLLEGWFPVFPWMGILLLGSIICTHGDFIVREWILFLPVGLIMAGSGVTWLHYHPPIDEREGYSELFYPPGWVYIGAACGAIIAGTSLLGNLKPKFGLQLLRYLGSCSLFIYIVHSAVISFVLDKYFTDLSLKKFLLMYAAFAAAMILLAWVLFRVKQTEGWQKIPKPLRFVFGG